MRRTPRSSRGLTRCILALVVLLVGVLSAACSRGSAESKPLVVLVDSTRLAGVQLYQKTHPDANIVINTISNRAQIPAKVLLANHSSDGSWPDVVFAEPNIVSQVADAQHHFPLDLTNRVPQSILKKFSPGALASCTIDGRVVCLPNDLAQGVLWYNAKLMKKFGYDVPKTWAQYKALGMRVAKEHPGYVIGSFSANDGLQEYFWPSDCPMAHVVGPDTVHIDATAPTCTRVADLIDPLIKAGVVSTLAPTSAAFVQKYGAPDKILMLPGASWYAEYVFKTTYKTPPGELAAALPLRWQDQDEPHAGTQGGSAWTVSEHTKHPELAIDVATWMATSMAYQASAPTYPAYRPAAKKWGESLATNKFFAQDPYPVLKQAADYIDPYYASVRYSPTAAFGNTVLHALGFGHSIASALPDFDSQLVDLARVSGYTVVRADPSDTTQDGGSR